MGFIDDGKRAMLKKAVESNKISRTEVTTSKGGEFHAKGSKDVPLPFPEDKKVEIKILAKLVKPPGVSVDGVFAFNGVKRSFSARTGDKKDLGKFELKPKNTTNLDGKTDPAQPDGTKLLFETETIWVD